MSFTGDLEHLPIVDVVQLLHATRKSGTLSVRGKRGRCQLVFKDGFIVSANYPTNSLRIGRILAEANVITLDILNKALQEQESAGEGRKPLIATLIEGGHVKKEDAFRGLEILIELTIVEILTWNAGTFSLDVENVEVADDYRYFPENLKQEITLDTQSVLMDALRLYDEKKRDGEISDEEDAAPEVEPAPEISGEISAEMLGLDGLEELDRKIPGVFSGLDDSGFDEAAARGNGWGLSAEEQAELRRYLEKKLGEAAPAFRGQGAPPPVVLFSTDLLLRQALSLLGKQVGTFVFATSDPGDLDPILEQSIARQATPVLVFDAPRDWSEGSVEAMEEIRRHRMQAFPQVPVLQLVDSTEEAFGLKSLQVGARAIFPKPGRDACGDFLGRTLSFLEALRAYLRNCTAAPSAGANFTDLQELMSELRQLRQAPEIATFLLRQVALAFGRGVTLIIKSGEAVAEKTAGAGGVPPGEIGGPLGVRIPLTGDAVLRRVAEEGRVYFGEAEEGFWSPLYARIGAPASPHVFLLPLHSGGRTVSVTYADFGSGAMRDVPFDMLRVLADHAGVVLENALYLKRLHRPA